MELLAEYGLFFAKVVTVVIALVIIISAIAAQSQRGRPHGLTSGHIEIRKINEQYENFEQSIKHAVLPEKFFKLRQQQKKKQEKQHKKNAKPNEKPHIYYLNFEGDVKASAVEKLRHEISAILTVAGPKDEVVINIESPGGMVHTYGLAASQMKRLRTAGIPLTVCVDKVAASGGYLMACVADRILAAPFAIVGSIGVLAQIPNFNRALKRIDVDYEIMTAGEHKAPITMFGEITEKGRTKLKEELETTHTLFKRFITDHRPQVPVDQVATGEVWYGSEAVEKQLVDDILTSDDYLMSQRKEKEIFEISFIEKKSLQEKLGLATQHGISGAINALLKREQEVTATRNV